MVKIEVPALNDLNLYATFATHHTLPIQAFCDPLFLYVLPLLFLVLP